MEVIITKNYQKMSEVAASVVARAIAKNKKIVLALPTGKTPRELYRFLIKAYRRGSISFKKAVAFNLDEYIGLSPADKASYHFYMKEFFFKFIDIKSKNIFIPDGQARLPRPGAKATGGQAKNLAAECRRYEREIKKQNGLDLAILGLGKNDHLGFNEPGSSFNSKTRVVKLSEATRKTNAKFFKGRKIPNFAITMGLKTIFSAKKIILLASGREKAEAVKKALKAPISPQIPASILRQHPNVIFILDRAAAFKIKK
ncbi:MAG: glucosamine-6-phosphate deaminase [bacterium]